MEEYIYKGMVYFFNLKVLVVGNAGVGKTSMIRRYVHDMFSNNYKSTVKFFFSFLLDWS
jgi:Ras-related protein Rab-32